MSARVPSLLTAPLAGAAVLAIIAGTAAIAQTGSSPPPPRTFANACATCHENAGLGSRILADRLGAEGASLRRSPALPAAYIRLVVRRGLGAMPAVSRIEVSDAELDAIIAEITDGNDQ